MRVVVMAVPPGGKIRAIKAIRSATGMDLRGGKDLVDLVESGSEQAVDLLDAAAERFLIEGGIAYRRVDGDVTLTDFVGLLGRYPRHLAVGDLVDALRVVCVSSSWLSSRGEV